jgi:hypothetical protein
MPTYNFKDKKSGEISEEVLKMSELDKFVRKNPHLEQVIVVAPTIGDPTRYGKKTKPSDGFRSVLGTIKKRFKGSTINTV